MKHPFVLSLLLSVSVTGIAATIKVPADQPTVQAGVNGKIDMGVYALEARRARGVIIPTGW
jgi:hypothetical protein